MKLGNLLQKEQKALQYQITQTKNISWNKTCSQTKTLRVETTSLRGASTMKFSTRAEYAIRALVDLSMHHEDKHPLKLHVIAERQEISLKYLEQLFIPLRKAGIVRGMRGPIGGYRLARPPHKIRLKEILDLLGDSLCDQEPEMHEPNDEKNRFLIEELQQRVTQAIRDVLESITLEELRNRQSSVLRQLRILQSFDDIPTLPRTQHLAHAS
jgi:Rrf2 family iron-sulfur cluster assembly transcriptional regulator